MHESPYNLTHNSKFLFADATTSATVTTTSGGCDYQSALDEFCGRMSTTGNALFQCDEAAGFDGEMVARVGLNVNGNQLKWRCYGELLSTSTEDACMANDGSMTNVGCTDPDHSNNAICARNAMMLAIITDLTATGCLETTTTSTTTSTTTTSTTTSTTTTSTTTSTTTTSTTTSTTTTSTTAGTTSEMKRQ